jgi:hypothetical protein
MGRINPKREVSRSPRAISLQRIPQVDPAFVSRRALSGREAGLSKREYRLRRGTTCSAFDLPHLRHVRGGFRFDVA